MLSDDDNEAAGNWHGQNITYVLSIQSQHVHFVETGFLDELADRQPKQSCMEKMHRRCRLGHNLIDCDMLNALLVLYEKRSKRDIAYHPEFVRLPGTFH